jgi:hypothetical protein
MTHAKRAQFFEVVKAFLSMGKAFHHAQPAARLGDVMLLSRYNGQLGQGFFTIWTALIGALTPRLSLVVGL